MKLLSLRAYAKHRGVTLEAVRKAIAAGRIQTHKDTKGKPGIDPTTADKAWAETTDPSMQRTPAAPSDPMTNKTSSNFAAARAMREAYLANLAKLNYEEKIGKLVDGDSVKKAVHEKLRVTRDAILNIPNRIAAQLASESDPHKIHLMLEAEINRTLEELAHALGRVTPS